MYPITCKAGFSIPAKAGKFDVLGYSVRINDETADSEFALVDDSNIIQGNDSGYVLGSLTNQKTIIAHVAGLANLDSVLAVMFPEPIKTRYGLSILATNLLPGSIIVYMR